MQLSHAAAAVDVAFDDPNLIADAGLVPVLALAEQIGLAQLVEDCVKIHDADNSAGANPGAKVLSLVAGMVAGADSIEDIDRLRHTGDGLLFPGVRAPSTLGTFLRAFTHGHVQQLNAVLRQGLIALAAKTPLLPGSDQVVFVDLDSTHRQVYGYAKQGAARRWSARSWSRSAFGQRQLTAPSPPSQQLSRPPGAKFCMTTGNASWW